MAAKVDYQGENVSGELKQVRSKTGLTFKIDHFEDRVKAFETSNLTFKTLSSPRYKIIYKKGKDQADGIFNCTLTLELQKEENKEGENLPNEKLLLKRIGFFLRPTEDTARPVTVRFSASRPGDWGSTFIYTYTRQSGYGWPDYFKKHRLARYCAIDGSLTIHSTVTVLFDTAVHGPLARETEREPLFSSLQIDLRRSDFPADFALISADGHKISCVKAILAARSPVFRNMLTSGNFKEATESQIEIKEFRNRTLKTFWHFCLTDYVDVSTGSKLKSEIEKEMRVETRGRRGRRSSDICPIHPETSHLLIVQNLLILADKYDIPSLKNKATEWLLLKVTPRNALTILEVGAKVNAKRLIDGIVYYIVNNRTNENFTLEKITAQDLPREVYELIINAFW